MKTIARIEVNPLCPVCGSHLFHSNKDGVAVMSCTVGTCSELDIFYELPTVDLKRFEPLVKKEVSPFLGEKAFCHDCKKEIQYVGRYWEHTTTSPKHPASPENEDTYRISDFNTIKAIQWDGRGESLMKIKELASGYSVAVYTNMQSVSQQILKISGAITGKILYANVGEFVTKNLWSDVDVVPEDMINKGFEPVNKEKA